MSMTNAERELFSTIERELALESPDLARLFGAPAGRARHPWRAAAVLTACTTLALLGLGLLFSSVAVAVFAACPLLTLLVLLLGQRLGPVAMRRVAARSGRPNPGRPTG